MSVCGPKPPDLPTPRFVIAPPGSGPPRWRRYLAAPVTLPGPLIAAENDHALIGADTVVAHPHGMALRMVGLLRHPLARERTFEPTVPTFRSDATQPWLRGFIELAVCVAGEPVFLNTQPEQFPPRSSCLGFSSNTPMRAEAEVILLSLPQEGPVEIRARWPAVGVSESVVEIDLSAIHAAAATARLWE